MISRQISALFMVQCLHGSNWIEQCGNGLITYNKKAAPFWEQLLPGWVGNYFLALPLLP